MKRVTTRNEGGFSRTAWVLGAAALGAVAMYAFDPEQGKRRRELARDKIYNAGMKARDSLQSTTADLRNKARGMAAEAKRATSEATSDVAASSQSASGNVLQ